MKEDPWVTRTLDTASILASGDWGVGWAMLTPRMRRAFIALEAMVVVAALDENGDSVERAARLRQLADTIIVDPDLEGL